jgi:hypothetical protein
MIALIGNSGVGKSSLVQAGIIGSLKRQRWSGNGQTWPTLLKDSRAWAFLSMRPGEDPIDALASAFASLWFPADSTDPDRVARRRKWVGLLKNGEAGLADLIETTDARFKTELGLFPPRRFLLYIDQGEELYSRVPKGQIKTFSELIARGLGHPRLVVMTSQRSDYYGHLQANEQLFPLTERIDIAPLGAEALKTVLRQPAHVLGATLESDDLIDQIVASTEDQPGALPLLTDLFTDLWDRMQARGDGTLRMTDRREIIHVGAALARRADGLLAAHPVQIEAIKRLFTLRLAHEPRHGEPVRRRMIRTASREKEWQLAEALAGSDWRLLVTGETEGQAYAEVAHEVLLNAWPTLDGWLKAQREFLIWRDDVEVRRQEYDNTKGRQRRDALLMGLPLTQAAQWLETRRADIDPPEQQFIKASAQADRARRRTLWGTAAAAFVALFVFATVATNAALEQRRQRDLAVQQKDLATFAVDAVQRTVGPVSGLLLRLADRAQTAVKTTSPADQARAYLEFANKN